MTENTQQLLREEGAETALDELANEVEGAADDMRRLLAESPEGSWTIREFQDAVANDRSSTVMNLAFLKLLRGGELRLGSDRLVRPIAA